MNDSFKPASNKPTSDKPTSDKPTSPKSAPEGPNLRRLVAYSLVTGLCPLIPIPFLDDWTRDLLRRRHAASIAESHGVSLSEDSLAMLALGAQAFDVGGCARGCLSGAALKTVLYVVKKLFLKIFRTIAIVLTFRSCAREFNRTFHEAFLLDHALSLGTLTADNSDEGAAEHTRVGAVRQAIEATCEETKTGPITRIALATFLGSRGLVRHAASTLSRQARRLRRRQATEDEIRRQFDQEGEEKLGSLIDTLAAEVAKEEAYLDGLQERLAEHLATP